MERHTNSRQREEDGTYVSPRLDRLAELSTRTGLELIRRGVRERA